MVGMVFDVGLPNRSVGARCHVPWFIITKYFNTRKFGHDVTHPYFVPIDSSCSLSTKLDLTNARKQADEIPAEPNIMHITMI